MILFSYMYNVSADSQVRMTMKPTEAWRVYARRHQICLIYYFSYLFRLRLRHDRSRRRSNLNLTSDSFWLLCMLREKIDSIQNVIKQIIHVEYLASRYEWTRSWECERESLTTKIKMKLVCQWHRTVRRTFIKVKIRQKKLVTMPRWRKHFFWDLCFWNLISLLRKAKITMKQMQWYISWYLCW